MATTMTSRSNASRLALLVSAVALIGTLAVVAIAFLSPPVVDKAPFAAGAVDDFARGSVTYFEAQHFYLVRTDMGEFMALYDLDPRQQARGNQAPEARNCRLTWFSAQEWSARGSSIAGTDMGAFHEPCHGATYNMEGLRLFGPSAFDLDRFPVLVEGDAVKVDLTERICGQRHDGQGQRDCGPVGRP